ncbi:hypothetical protein M406DRAFT_44410 [Cryphonectria parasitica EP155]|uniref:Structural maintenance of chromosomes protein 5 n=1 Tax=Cryphonectria parasitica (strain ATCC 38755 / EP155) TaxID=660469 RepID=A0A9P4Y9Z4_CRYP1|nr:uncharacterized protein M406DRAFT_44410 [Cryphonectria parasitica EP155]KAF3768765.1 hypothetical protein M406DRAFT_44410 [Cryphonectria parasitica EP155]
MRLRGGRGAPAHLETEDDEELEDEDTGDEFRSFTAASISSHRTNGHSTINGSSTPDFAPGAIVRVMVENFVTYEKAEFLPGPNLNMVIGPNGTGKSSLVCAICLGLAFPASTLGRSTSFGDFVKHGKEHAIVEVELQRRPQDRKNYVFRLQINREDNTRQFWLNGHPCKLADVKLRMKELRIQIDNLCQFLPQDRVAEFAGLNPVDLLTRTLQAAAPEEVIKQQEELRTLFGQQKESQHSLDTQLESLRSMHTRQEGLQGDVDRLREREQIRRVIKDLQDSRLIVHYNEKKALFEQIKEQRKRARQQQRRLEEMSAPSLEAVNLKQEYKAKIDVALRARRRRLMQAEEAADKALEAVQQVEESTKLLEAEKAADAGSMVTHRQAVSAQRTKITKLEGQYKNGRDIEAKFNPAEWNHKIRECTNRIKNEFWEKLRELDTTRNDILDRGKAKRTQVKAIQEEIESLNSQEGQRLVQLRRIDREVATAYQWLQEHQSEFEKEVFGPPMLSCSVKDRRYSNHIQMCLQRDDFLCFIAQTRADHGKLTEQFFKKMNLAVPVRTIMADLTAFKPPVPREGLQGLGLDGYAIDYLEGPDPVLAMLCSEKKLHLTGLALKEISEQQYQRITDGEVINSFATGNTYHRTTRCREYGPGATSTVTTTIRPGRFWGDEPLDVAARTKLEQDLEVCARELEELKQQFNEVKTQQSDIDNESKEEQKRLKNLEGLREQLEQAKQRVLSYDAKFKKMAHKKAKIVLEHQKQLKTLREASQAVLAAQTRHIEANSDLEALKERNKGIVQQLEEERKKLEELVRRVDEVKAEARNAQTAIRELLTIPDTDGEMDIERRDYLVRFSEGKTLEGVAEDIQVENSKLELIHDADPGLLRDFEKRAKDIKRQQAEIEKRQAALDKLKEEIQEKRQNWEPSLDEIVRRINDAFSYNFEQINCAGEVGVHKDEDFDKWAIEIKVKFRENETLQKLDQHRQSGGERAVSTIFYLMSLQAMAQAPFRVVDEINQGMDPRNERLVHERMVEIACKEHTSQYFLITPKLLPGLRYDERMKVMCIASGEHMPADGGKMDFAKCASIKKRLLAAASA